jgi:hypothetical protein
VALRCSATAARIPSKLFFGIGAGPRRPPISRALAEDILDRLEIALDAFRTDLQPEIGNLVALAAGLADLGLQVGAERIEGDLQPVQDVFGEIPIDRLQPLLGARHPLAATSWRSPPGTARPASG